MAGEGQLAVIGSLTAAPETRFTASGAAVVSFTVASTPRTWKDGEWKDGEAVFLRCTAWRQLAENIGESLDKGTRVIVTGRLKQRSFETKEGERRTVMEMDADEVGPSLKFAAAKVLKAERSSGGASAADDPWSQATPARPARSAASAGGFS